MWKGKCEVLWEHRAGVASPEDRGGGGFPFTRTFTGPHAKMMSCSVIQQYLEWSGKPLEGNHVSAETW